VASHVLVLGGQRSGKSRFAENLVAASSLERIYLATATAGDREMSERIARHRSRRDSGWRTIEEPLDIAARVASEAKAASAVLVECLTLWLSNLMAADRDVETAMMALLGALSAASGPVVLVSNEVGSGIVPENALARRYADALGVLNQRVAAAVDRVFLVVAGRPLLLQPAETEFRL
jgi:adenosylcobinamide kinase/adenosylcobinamide-phosphate guanylyltransferase